MTDEITHFILPALGHLQGIGYWVAFIAALVETALVVGLFIPGSTLLLFLGALSASGRLDFTTLLWFAVAGAIIGDNLNYWLGKRYGQRWMRNGVGFLKQEHFDFYPITAVMIILLAFFNDVPIMTIAYDHTILEKEPVRWDMRQVITVATGMGIVGVVGSFGMLLLAMDWLKLDVGSIQAYVFLKMAVAGHLVLFVARTRGHFWEQPWPAPIMLWSALITKLAATLLAAYGLGVVTAISWPEIALIWGYSIVSAFITDLIKVQIYRHLDNRVARHHEFLNHLKRPLHVSR